MKVRITGRIFGADGMVPVGTEVTVSAVPPGWAGKCEVVDAAKGKTMVVNPEAEEPSKADLIQQAEELGIDVKSSWNKDKLQEEIDAALEK